MAVGSTVHRLRQQLHQWRQTAQLLANFGERRYGPFIVLGRPRTGSNLLQGLLHAHPEVRAYGEIFSDLGPLDWKIWPYHRLPRAYLDRMYRQMRNSPERFLQTKIFRRLPKQTRALGFRLFYHHSRKGAGQALWRYLKSQEHLRVVHLKRHNLLRTHLSHTVARQTGKWVSHGQQRIHSAVFLPISECKDVFESIRAREMELDRFFQRQRVLEVSYEDISSDRDGSMRRIFEFLGVQNRSVVPRTHKQACLKLNQAIANYTELREHFQNTQWAGFFEE